MQLSIILGLIMIKTTIWVNYYVSELDFNRLRGGKCHIISGQNLEILAIVHCATVRTLVTALETSYSNFFELEGIWRETAAPPSDAFLDSA